MCVPALFMARGASGTTAATLAAVSQVGIIVGGTMMSVNAQKGRWLISKCNLLHNKSHINKKQIPNH